MVWAQPKGQEHSSLYSICANGMTREELSALAPAGVPECAWSTLLWDCRIRIFRLRLREVFFVPGNRTVDAVHYVPRLANPVSFARIAHEDGVYAHVLQRHVVLFRFGD